MDGIASNVPLIARPSFDRACSFVPSEYVQAWEWFLREEQRGGLWDKLPHRTNADSPQYPFRLTIDSELFPVSRDSGIFWPGRGRVKHPREKTFALSVHNSKRGAYPDVPPLYLEDGTWVLKYSSQSASVENWRDQDYNQKMINCMECGVPVGVFFATSVGYKVLGLAFVERYEPENSWFVLHGPVHKGGPDARFFPDMSYIRTFRSQQSSPALRRVMMKRFATHFVASESASSVFALSSLMPIPVDAPSRVATSTKRSKPRISRTTRVLSHRLSATVSCCAVICTRSSTLI